MKIALIGYGKMGKMIEAFAVSRNHQISYIIDIANSNDINHINPANTDVAIEFTSPHTAFENVKKCLSNGVNVVCGSTGWNQMLSEAYEICKKTNTGFIWSSNFSIGVNLFFKINELVANIMKQYEQYRPSMKEIHHIHKKDAPSGTAITLAEGILRNYKQMEGWSLAPCADEKKLIIEAERTGEVPGTHIIKYDSPVDSIEITHIAKSREGFALGAVIAAEFLNGKKGIYSMKDVLNL